jgi:hypothetical protein
MNKLDLHAAVSVGKSLGINWNSISPEEFTMGINVEFEHGTKFPETNITNDDKKLTGQIAWAHLKEFPDYYYPAYKKWKRKLLNFGKSLSGPDKSKTKFESTVQFKHFPVKPNV